jgi:tRNA(Ile)-lysidine synthase
MQSADRREIVDYLHAGDLPYRTDLSNYALDFTRNRIRQELLPQLEREYAPRLRERLQNLGQLAREDNAVLEAMTEMEFARLCRPVPDGLALPDAPDLPLALCRRLWRRAIAQVRGNLAGIGFEHLEAIRRLPALQQVHLPGVHVVHETGRLVFLPGGGEVQSVIISEQPLPLPGRWCADTAGCCIMTEILPSPIPIEGGNVALLDAQAITGTLRVRSWQPGDRFQPLGAPGSRKVQDIFVDAGLPKRLRSRIPLVLDEKGIVWLAGFRIADRVKMQSTTSQMLRFNITWLLNPWTLTPSAAGR